MNSKKGLLILCAPAVGVALLLASVALRPGESPAERPAVGRLKPARNHAAPPPARTVTPPVAAPASVVSRASEDVRIRSTYQNYRTAVATGNAPLQKALHPVLVRDREMAVRCAEEDLARARSEFDRDVTRKTLEALRN